MRSRKLPGVRIADGILIVSPQRSNVPKAAEAAKGQCLARMPLIEISDLAAGVDAWSGFSDCFIHLRTGKPVRSLPPLCGDPRGPSSFTYLGHLRTILSSAISPLACRPQRLTSDLGAPFSACVSSNMYIHYNTSGRRNG